MTPDILIAQENTVKQLEKENRRKEQEIRLAKTALPKDLEILEDVDEVLQRNVLSIIRQKAARKEEIIIENFGLDLESVIPWLRNRIIHPTEFDDIQITLKSLIINPNSPFLKDIIDGESNVTSVAASSSISNAKKLSEHKDLSKFSLIIKQYDHFPIIHGFIINNEHLFLGFSCIENGKLMGGIEPYIHLTKTKSNNAGLTNYYFSAFNGWFNHYWDISEEVVHINK